MKIASLSLLLFAAAAARADSPALAHAIHAFNDFQDAQATAELERLILAQPDGREAARAHLYLGLIAVNALDSARARAEFRAALAIEPTLEPPYEASPKARVVFEQAQKEFMQSGAPAAPGRAPALAPAAVPVVVENAPAAAARAVEAPRSKVPGIVLTSIAAAVLGTGVGFGVWQSQTLNPASVADVKNVPSAQSQAATQGVVADVCFGVGGGLGVAGLILLVYELTGPGAAAPTALRVTPAPGGVAAAVAF